MEKQIKVDISARTILKIAAILGALYLFYLIRDIIALFIIVLIMVAAFSPIVTRWAKKISRPGAVAALIVLFITAIALIVSIVIPPFINQTVKLFQNAPEYLDKVTIVRDHIPEIKKSLSSLSSELGNVSSRLITVTSSIFGGVVSIIMALVIFIYLISDENNLKKFALSVFHDKKKNMAAEVLQKISNKAGNWFRGQMFLCLIIAVIDLVGLSLLGIPYAVTLAIVAGLLEFIPTIGPITAGVLAVLVALGVSPVKALMVAILFIIVQQLENTLIVPKIMQKAVGLSPVIIIFAILIGAKLYGLMGVILSVPFTASLMVIIQEWPRVKQLFDNQEQLL